MSWRGFRPDIRQRLWIALGLLAASTVFVGAVAWVSLDRANLRLEQLHRQTLTAVARSLNLSKQSGDLATSAPFLLNLKSPYLIDREGRALMAALDPVLRDWPQVQAQAGSVVSAFETDIVAAVRAMKAAISDLVDATGRLNAQADKAIVLNAQLSELETQVYRQTTDASIGPMERRAWLALQVMTNQLVGAGRAKNLLGVGENRRNFQHMRRGFQALAANGAQRATLADLERLSAGENGLFEVRRRELSHRLDSQNALFRIRYHAGIISDLAAEFANNAEGLLTVERASTATSIRAAKIVIAIAGLASAALALISAVFVSGYVTRNIRSISEAMLRLAEGDRATTLRGKPKSNDEIGSLHHSFRVFRANALRLDRSNRQLHQKNALFERVFANISDGIALSCDNGEIRTTNRNVDRVLRVDTQTLPAKFTIRELLAQTDYADSAKTAGIDADFRGFTELEGNGQTLEIRCSGLPDGGGVWLFSDTTQRRKMEQRLRQIQHIESLGKVTGEVAHDFGNVLSAISTNVHLLEGARVNGSDPRLERIANAVDIGTHLTQRLLAFARQQALAPEVVELNELVEGLADLIAIGLKDGVELVSDIAPEKMFVRVDPGQLESAILNLCLNSNQAIEGRGEIRISARQPDGDCVVIEVSDTGCGMEEAVADRALEPFFTARADGEGTGLGLSMVYGFIKQTGGDIQISSVLGQGSTIRLTLPLWHERVAMAPVVESGKTVLLVEDDIEALTNVSQQLREIGYAVSKANSFAEAQVALSNGAQFDALVTDLHLDLGQMGWELAQQGLEKSQAMQIVVASGRMPKTHPFSDGAEPRVVCLAKPLTPQKLKVALKLGLEA